MTNTLFEALARIIDFYLSDAQKESREDLIKLSKGSDTGSWERIKGYVREGLRLKPETTGVYRQVASDDDIPQGVHVRKGDLLFLHYKDAQLNVRIIRLKNTYLTISFIGLGLP